MPPQTKDSYLISGNSLEDIKRELNFVMQRIADRLDKMEGVRDVSSPTFDDVAVGGDITVTDSDDEVIHSLG